MIATWMVYATVVASCAACVALAADAWSRASRRPTRWIWAVSIAAGVMIPALVAIRPRASASAPAPAWTVPALSGQAAATRFDPAFPDRWLGALWAAASVTMAAILLASMWQLARTRQRAGRHRLEGRLVAVTPNLGPGAVPFGEPSILVPQWVTKLPADAVRLLMAHETEHVRAGDARLVFAATLLVAATPWNAALWYCLRRMRTAIELDCDARVLRAEPAVAAYADLLLQVAARVGRRVSPALLTFTYSTVQLRTRIDAMTLMRTMTPLSRAAFGALALAALAVGCEARRPAPVAPVTDYVLQSGQASALTLQQAESAKVRIAGDLPLRATGAGGEVDDPSKPMVMVSDATGTVVFAARASTASEALIGAIPPGDIQRVEIVKRGDLLPPGAKGGMITITLKPGATWRSPTAGDTTMHYRSPAPEGVTLRRREGPPPTVILEDAAGAVVYEGSAAADRAGSMVGPWQVPPEAIARVDVTKAREPGGPDLLRIRLKAGVVLTRVP